MEKTLLWKKFFFFFGGTASKRDSFVRPTLGKCGSFTKVSSRNFTTTLCLIICRRPLENFLAPQLSRLHDAKVRRDYFCSKNCFLPSIDSLEAASSSALPAFPWKLCSVAFWSSLFLSNKKSKRDMEMSLGSEINSHTRTRRPSTTVGMDKLSSARDARLKYR